MNGMEMHEHIKRLSAMAVKIGDKDIMAMALITELVAQQFIYGSDPERIIANTETRIKEMAQTYAGLAKSRKQMRKLGRIEAMLEQLEKRHPLRRHAGATP